jgi:hypothetical protein
VDKIAEIFPAYGCCAKSNDGWHSISQRIISPLAWGIKQHWGKINFCKKSIK